MLFKVHRGFVTEDAVESLAVVKDFDPLEDGGGELGRVWRTGSDAPVRV